MSPRHRGGHVVTVFGAHPGAGTTTVATNLAAALAGAGGRQVCLVDLDLAYGDVAGELRLPSVVGVAEAVALGDEPDPDRLRALLTPHSPGLTTLLAPALGPHHATTAAADGTTALLAALRGLAYTVVADTPPSYDDHVVAALRTADVVALVGTPGADGVEALALCLETLDLLGIGRDRLRIVVNRVDSHAPVADLERLLGTHVDALLPESDDLADLKGSGLPLVLRDPGHPLSEAVRTFARRSSPA